MKRKILFLIVASLISCQPLPIFANAADIDSMTLDELKAAYLELEEKYNVLLGQSELTEQEQVSNSDFVYATDDYTYKFLKHEVKISDDDKDYLFIYFEFTNNSGHSTTPFYTDLNVKAFQNGVSLTQCISNLYSDTVPEEDIAFKNIQDGTTVTIALRYILSDDSAVSLEINPMIIWDDTEIGKYTFEL